MDGAGKNGVVLISLGTLAQFGALLPSLFYVPTRLRVWPTTRLTVEICQAAAGQAAAAWRDELLTCASKEYGDRILMGLGSIEYRHAHQVTDQGC